MQLGSRIALALIITGMLQQVCFAQTGRATIKGTSPDSTVSGEVLLGDTEEGLTISVVISDAPEGTHGFHIHQFGSCDDGGKAAGGHYNPDQAKHGDLLKDGHAGAHAGDLGNISIAANRNGSLQKVLPNLTLSSGPYSVAGRAVILHADEDDYGQPTGNAGSRIGCGTIIITGN